MMRATMGLAAALSLLSASATAQTSDPSCFSEREFEDLLIIMTPAALKLMADQCRSVLPSGAVIGNPNSAFAKSIEVASDEAWPRAMPSIHRVMKSQGETPDPGDATMTREVFVAGIVPLLGKIITKPASCVPFDRMLKLAEPLPPRNLAGIFVQLARIMPSGKNIKVLCPVKAESLSGQNP